MAQDEFERSPFLGESADKDGGILQAIYRAIDEVNPQLPPGNRIDKSPDTVLLGESAHLDSLTLISLIVAIEQEIDRTFHVTVNLIDTEDITSMQTSPIRTIGSLVHHASERLTDQHDVQKAEPSSADL